jgi:Zn-dependent M28 family amino/carboxypeptidase
LSRYPIEGHAYGGEEGGLLGSSAVAHAYKTSERQLRGMLNLEMVGWQPETEGSSTITVLVDPNEEMSRYMEDVVREYVPTAVVRSTTCGVRFLPSLSAFLFLLIFLTYFPVVHHSIIKPNLTDHISTVARITTPGPRSATR